VIDPAHWDGLPDGHTRASVVEAVEPPQRPHAALEPLSALLTRHHADLKVATRPLVDYVTLAAASKEDR
jgi:hypothetical protein